MMHHERMAIIIQVNIEKRAVDPGNPVFPGSAVVYQGYALASVLIRHTDEMRSILEVGSE